MRADAAVIEVSDRELLRRFAAQQDQDAFAALVARHGGLVLGVCRRVLRDTHEAEEAFQAAFLVLARKAGSLAWQESIASWLYSVAHRTALKHRGALARRRQIEAAASAAGDRAENPSPSLHELSELIDAELARLPENLRGPLVLCHLEGLSRAEAAERLGMTTAAIKDRLERGRALLRDRLTRRGVTLSAAVFGGLVLASPASAAVPEVLAASTSAMVAGNGVAGTFSATILALAEGVLRTMFFEKFKAAAVLLVSLLTIGTAASVMLADAPDRFAIGVRGEVVAVDSSKSPSNVTIKLDEQDVLVNFDVQADANVVYAYQKAKFADLAKGTWVSLRLGKDHRTVIEIQARGDVRQGDVQAFDLAQRKITVLVDHDDEEDTEAQPQTFTIAPDAQARFDGRPALVEDLEQGMQVRLEFAKHEKIVTGIEGNWARPEDIQGEVHQVDAGALSLVVRTEIDDAEAEIPFALIRDAKIRINGNLGKLEDLKKGSDVTLRLSEDRKAVVGLRAVVGKDANDEKEED